MCLGGGGSWHVGPLRGCRCNRTTPWAFRGVTLVDGGSSKGPGEGSLTVDGAIKACARLGA